MNNLILQPVVLMCLLSFLMMVWMYATRIPASKEIEKKGIDLQDLSHPSKLGGVFPSKVERGTPLSLATITDSPISAIVKQKLVSNAFTVLL